MKLRSQAAVLTVLLLATACFSLPSAPLAVRLFDAEGKFVGFVDITERDPGVRLRVHTIDLDGGVHGFHIHENPVCEPPDFVTAGPHFNPGGKEHGSKNPNGHHAGDLPNITVGTSGNWADTTIDWPDVQLNDGDRGLFHNGGTSLIIHQNPDDELTDPSGNAGPRIACGVIKKLPEERF